MQSVSSEYRNSMKSILRDRSYIRVIFGMYNQEAQSKATISGDTMQFSDRDVFNKRDHVDYATYETDFSRVNGTMFFMPRSNAEYKTCYVADKEDAYSMTINLNIPATKISGLKIDFGDTYPTDFTITSSSGKTVTVTDNKSAEWGTKEVFDSCTSLTLNVTKMAVAGTRLRIKSIDFGYALYYTNDDVMDSELSTSVSPIASEITQIDFSVKIKNYDGSFDLDNPNSVVNSFETGDQIEVWYGYQLKSGIEWFRGATLRYSATECDKSSATIRAVDRFRNMETTYGYGKYNANGVSLYDLATAVFTDAGITDYYIEPLLKNIKTRNPIPRVKTKEALQLIANAGRCILTQNRNGYVQIKSAFVPKLTATSNGEQTYSNVSNVVKEVSKNEYAVMWTDYVSVDGSSYFMPRDTKNATLSTGYISKEISKVDCTFATNPVVTITLDASHLYDGMNFVFGNCIPAALTIQTYLSDTLVDTYTPVSITKEMHIDHTFAEFNKMVITFSKTEKPYCPIAINTIQLGELSNYLMDKSDILSDIKVTKQDLLKEVDCEYYLYQPSSAVDTLTDELYTAAVGDTATFFFTYACYGYSATYNGTAMTIVDSGAYFITVKFTKAGTGAQLVIKGNKYNLTTIVNPVSVNSRGNVVSWKNPLIDNKNLSNNVGSWVADYYSSDTEYSYNTRGNPELDANDLIYQANDYNSELMTTITKHTVKFEQALSGSEVTRKFVAKKEV